ncbi:hypothetical protein AMTRI_Chr12g270920 [Amborella trichopoda]
MRSTSSLADQGAGKWSLCLSNKVICCIDEIDEIDKISNSARSLLHETQLQDGLDLPTLIAYVSYSRRHIHPQITDEAIDDLIMGYVEMRRGNFSGSSK